MDAFQIIGLMVGCCSVAGCGMSTVDPNIIKFDCSRKTKNSKKYEYNYEQNYLRDSMSFLKDTPKNMNSSLNRVNLLMNYFGCSNSDHGEVDGYYELKTSSDSSSNVEYIRLPNDFSNNDSFLLDEDIETNQSYSYQDSINYLNCLDSTMSNTQTEVNSEFDHFSEIEKYENQNSNNDNAISNLLVMNKVSRQESSTQIIHKLNNNIDKPADIISSPENYETSAITSEKMKNVTLNKFVTQARNHTRLQGQWKHAAFFSKDLNNHSYSRQATAPAFFNKDDYLHFSPRKSDNILLDKEEKINTSQTKAEPLSSYFIRRAFVEKLKAEQIKHMNV